MFGLPVTVVEDCVAGTAERHHLGRHEKTRLALEELALAPASLGDDTTARQHPVPYDALSLATRPGGALGTLRNGRISNPARWGSGVLVGRGWLGARNPRLPEARKEHAACDSPVRPGTASRFVHAPRGKWAPAPARTALSLRMYRARAFRARPIRRIPPHARTVCTYSSPLSDGYLQSPLFHASAQKCQQPLILVFMSLLDVCTQQDTHTPRHTHTRVVRISHHFASQQHSGLQADCRKQHLQRTQVALFSQSFRRPNACH